MTKVVKRSEKKLKNYQRWKERNMLGFKPKQKLKSHILKKRIDLLDALLNNSGTDDEELKIDTVAEIFDLNNIGEASCLAVPLEERCPLPLRDIYSLLRVNAASTSSKSLRWGNLSKRCNIVLVIVDGIGVGELKEDSNICDGLIEEIKGEDSLPLKKYRVGPMAKEPRWLLSCLPKSGSIFPIRLETEKGSSNPEELLRDIIFAEATSAERILGDMKKGDNQLRKKKELLGKSDLCWDSVQNKSDAFDRRKLLLNLKAMLALGYPLPSQNSTFSNYRHTKDRYTEVTENSPIFGIDCEMCLTKVSQELSQISIVDENLKIIYSSYVKPPNKIINYVTKFSGVLPHNLKKCKVNLQNVQDFIRTNLPPDAILVGHSFQSDLRAIKMFHPYVIDTSVIYNVVGHRNAKTSLKVLTRLFLQKGIQTIDRSHDPTEDAIAALKLTLLKLRTDVFFGDSVLRGQIPYTWEELQNLTKVKSYEKHKRNETGKFSARSLYFDSKIQTNSIFYMLAKKTRNNKFNIVTARETMNICRKFVPLAHRTENNLISEENCLEKILSHIKGEDLKLQIAYVPKCDSKCDSEERMKRLREIDQSLKDLHSRLKEKDKLCIVMTLFSGSSNYTDRRANGCLLLDVQQKFPRKKTKVKDEDSID